MFWDDLRYAARKLRKNLGATSTLAAILALGIGASVTTFAVAHSVLLRPLPFPDGERLVTIYEQNLPANLPAMLISLPTFELFLDAAKAYDGLAAYQFTQPVTMTGAGQATRLETNFVTDGYFELLGVEADLGRVFSATEHATPMQHPVAVVSHAFWQARLGGDREVLGSTLTLNDTPFTVVGVLPARFDDLPSAGRATQVWLPMAMYPVTGYGWEILERRSTRFLATLARLRPEITLEQARAEMDELASRLARELPETHGGYSLVVEPLRENLVGTFRPAILALVAASAFLLLIGCANAANLLLVRASGRRQEVAMQLALGLGSYRLFRQLTLEGMLTATIAGAVGWLLARLGTDLLLRASPVSLPAFVEVEFDPQVVLLALGVTLLTGLLFGIVPALEGVPGKLRDVLYQAGRRGGGSRLGAGGRTGLIVVEVAMAVVLVAGALLMVRSFEALRSTAVGFETEDLLVLRTDLGSERARHDDRLRSFVRELRERLTAEPGVEEAIVWGPSVPGQALWYRAFAADGKVVRSMEDAVASRFHEVSPGALRALGVRLVAGRGIEAPDRADTPPVAVVSEAAAKALFPEGEAIGRRFYQWRSPEGSEATERITVVGIAEDTRQGGRATPGVGLLDVYLPFEQQPRREVTVLLRSGRHPGDLASSVRAVLAGLDSDLPVFDLATMQERLAREEEQPRFSAFLIASFASVALVLAALGLYSVIAYLVRQRTHEVGIRLALGGRPRDVVLELGGQAGRPVLVGLFLGLVGVAVASRLLAGFLYGVDGIDVATYVLVSTVLGGVAVAGSALPLRRAAHIDPVIALRAE